MRPNLFFFFFFYKLCFWGCATLSFLLSYLIALLQPYLSKFILKAERSMFEMFLAPNRARKLLLPFLETYIFELSEPIFCESFPNPRILSAVHLFLFVHHPMYIPLTTLMRFVLIVCLLFNSLKLLGGRDGVPISLSTQRPAPQRCQPIFT